MEPSTPTDGTLQSSSTPLLTLRARFSATCWEGTKPLSGHRQLSWELHFQSQSSICNTRRGKVLWRLSIASEPYNTCQIKATFSLFFLGLSTRQVSPRLSLYGKRQRTVKAIAAEFTVQRFQVTPQVLWKQARSLLAKIGLPALLLKAVWPLE